MNDVFYTYVLFSQSFNKIYIEFTSDIENRLLSHNVLAKKGWTIKFRPWKLIYSEVFNSGGYEKRKTIEIC